MPTDEYHGDTWQREVTVRMSISEHEQGRAVCPQCGGTEFRPLIRGVVSQTSRKS